MAQYKSFASQGSFSDFQMTSPDQSAKIEREAQRQIRGMERAQAFTERNRSIYEQAMKQAQATEQTIRDQNFKSEADYRRAYREAEAKNYQIEIENDANAAKQKHQTYKNLSEFSQTAFKLFGTIDETVKKAELGVKHKLALDAGLDLEDLKSLRGIEDKLSQSQFNQLAFIQQKVKDGASATQIAALYEIFKRSGSNQWYEMKSLYQNSVTGHAVFIQEGMQEMFADGATPTAEQIQARIESLNAQYIETKFAGARPEILESSGVYSTIRQNSNSVINSFYKQSAKEREENIKSDFLVSLNTDFLSSGRSPQTVVDKLNANPSAETRKNILGWAKQAVISGGISIDEAQAILDGKIVVGNNETTISKQFNGFPEVTDLAEAIKVKNSRNRTEAAQYRADQALEANAKAVDFLNEALKTNGGFLSDTDIETARESLLQNGGDQSAIEPFLGLTGDAQTSKLVDNTWESQYERTGEPPTIEQIYSYTKLDANTRNKWLQIRNARDKMLPDLREHEKAIRDQVKAAPQIQALGSATASGTVAMMQTRMVQKFKRLLKTTDPAAARAIVIEEIQKIQADPKAFDAQGNYASIMSEIRSDSVRARVDAKALNDSIAIILKQPKTRRDFKALSTAMGASTVYSNLDALNSGQKTSALFNNVAAKLKITPYELGVTLAKANGLQAVKPPIPDWDNLVQQATKNKKASYIRNTYREVLERTQRANVIDNRSGATAPVRNSFTGDVNVARFRKAIISQESGGSYTIVNPDSGAIGIGQVMPENVGPWTQRYLGKALTPEQFRMNPGAQDAVVNGRFKDMLADQRAAGFTGEQMVRRAAAVWYSGQANLWNYNKPEYYNGRRYPSIAEYTKSIWNKFQSNY